MDSFHLSGADKARLRARGQILEPALLVGHAGLSPGFRAELEKALHAHDLVKLRFAEPDRHARAALCERIAAEAQCACVGAVGRTALFFRPKTEPGAPG